MEAAITAKHVINNQKNEIGIENKQRGTAQRLRDHKVQVGRYDQVADKFTIFLDADRTDRDFGIPVHVIE